MNTVLMIALLIFVLVSSGCDSGSSAVSSENIVGLPKAVSTLSAPAIVASAQAGEVKTLNWDNLLPEEFQPDKLLQEYDVQNMGDGDPRAAELMLKLKAMMKEAPVVKALDGQTVRLPGFVVPLEGDGQVVNEFLLVPYYGACIHVPPPPANQMVYVKAQGRNVAIRRLFDTVWVTGVMKVVHVSSELGEAGYQMSAIEVTPYDQEQ